MIKEKKNILFPIIFFFLTLLGLSFVFANWICSQYQKELIRSIGEVIALSNQPEKMIDTFLKGEGNYEESKELLETYGLENIGYLKQYQKIDYKIIFYMVCFSSGIFLFFCSSYIIFYKKQHQKLQSLEHDINRILNDEEAMDIKSYKEGDMSTLKNDLYKLMIKLKEGRDQSLKDKKELEQTLSDISHQIKTPLTSMYVINDLLGKDDISKSAKQQFLEKNKTQLERIEWLVTSLLKISRLDSGSVVLKIQEENLNQILLKALEPLQIPMELKNIRVSIKGDPNIVVPMDPNWTIEVFVNVLKNAYEHTEIAGKIDISFSTNPLYTEVQIQDNGCGIKKEELPHIFDRFYTGSGNKDSIGIGLNMAKKIMEKQKGEIYATSIEGEGTSFFIKFYKTM